MKELLAELSQLGIHSFSVNLNKQKSTLVFFDYRKKITVEELFDTISRNCHDLFYRGIHSPLGITNINKYGIDCPNQSYAHFAIESYTKSLEYGKSDLGQIICGYSRDVFTDLIIPENGNTKSNVHLYNLTYNDDSYYSAVKQDDFNPGYDLVYGRAFKDLETIAPKVVVFLSENDNQVEWFQHAINVSKIYINQD